MRASSLITTLIAILVLLAAVPSLVPAQPAYGEDPADLDWCQRQCRDKFGVWLGRGSDTYYAYAQCIQDCNTAFWKDFDRKTRDLEKSR